MNQRLYDRVAALVSVLLLATLAAGTWYLAEMTNRAPGGGGSAKLAHEPDYFVKNFALTRLNAKGEAVFRMEAKRLEHFPDDDSTEFVLPKLVSLDPEKPLVTLRALRGNSTSQGLETHLHDEVVLTRAGDKGQPSLTVESDYVLLLSEEDVARTNRPVRITYGDSTLTGVGMEFNNGSRQLDVKSQVRGTWVAPPPTPKSNG